MLYEHSAPPLPAAAVPVRCRLPSVRLSAADDAAALLRVLSVRILAGERPLPGHAEAALRIGLQRSAAGYVGGLCRLIDGACREAGLPPLAAQGLSTGRANGAGRDSAAAAAKSRPWSHEDFERVLARLTADAR
jgi:hypothetical protein